jgi:hypothetical protein
LKKGIKMTARKVIPLGILLISSFQTLANDKEINLNTVAKYHDEQVIQSNIIDECTQLGTQFSTSTKKYLEKNGWSVNYDSNANENTKGTKLELKIINAMSSGNAFTGHRKSVSIEAKLFKDGTFIDSYKGTRNSAGGFLGGFKGSCAILAHCVNTLGNDVSKWLKKNDKKNIEKS